MLLISAGCWDLGKKECRLSCDRSLATLFSPLVICVATSLKLFATSTKRDSVTCASSWAACIIAIAVSPQLLDCRSNRVLTGRAMLDPRLVLPRGPAVAPSWQCRGFGTAHPIATGTAMTRTKLRSPRFRRRQR